MQIAKKSTRIPSKDLPVSKAMIFSLRKPINIDSNGLKYLKETCITVSYNYFDDFAFSIERMNFSLLKQAVKRSYLTRLLKKPMRHSPIKAFGQA